MNTVMDFLATHCCDSLPLRNSAESGLRVHSVFQRACNLQTPQGELWVIQAQGMPLAPMGIMINSSDLRGLFRPDERLQIDSKGNLRGQAISIDLQHVQMCSTRLPMCTHAPAFAQLARQIDAFFARQPVKGVRQALLTDDKLIAAHGALVRWLNCKEGELSQILTAFIGRGEGLTPAGDDFLVGVLLVMERGSDPEISTLKAILPDLLTRTTDISRAMLEQACRGHYSTQLLALINGNTRTWPALVAKVAEYGHSSGHDMLTGILTAARCSGERSEKTALHVGPL